MSSENELLERFGTLDDLPYNIVNIVDTNKGILVVDTREEVDSLISIGCVATHFPNGFLGWQPFYGQFFAGRSIYVIKSSLGHNALWAAHQLYPHASSIKIIEIQDVVAWVVGGGTKKQLANLISDTPEWDPPPKLVDIPGDAEESQYYTDDRLSEDGLKWEPPIDIFAKLKPPALKSELLPGAIQDYVQDQAELIGVDPGVIGMACLVVCASAIHDQIRIQPKEHEYGWTESARLWGAIVGDPSLKKSPSISKATKPLLAIEIDLEAQNSQALHDYIIDEKIYKKQEETYIKDATKAREAGEKTTEQKPARPDHPECPRALIEDTTIEGAREALRYNPRGILCLRDELSGWFGAMDAYSGNKGGGKDRPLWLELYNGGPKIIDRVHSGKVFVPNWSASIIGGIQPDIFRRVASNHDDDGLLQRFMVIIAQDAPDSVDRPPNREAAERYRNLVRHIFDIIPQPKPVLMSPGALQVKRDMDRQIRQFRAFGDVSLSLMSHLAKWEGLFPRLLLTYHVIRCADNHRYPDDQISVDTAAQVYKFMTEYLLPHAIHFYVEVLDQSDHMQHARWIAEFILSRGLESVTRRDIVASYRSLRGKPSWALKNAMGFLETAGWVQSSKFLTDGPTRWEVNPIIHTQFKEIAEKEQKRRAESRATLQARFRQIREDKNNARD